MLKTLEEDFARIPALLNEPSAAPATVIPFPAQATERAALAAEQLGLF
jgi:hypothetical protein